MDLLLLHHLHSREGLVLPLVSLAWWLWTVASSPQSRKDAQTVIYSIFTRELDAKIVASLGSEYWNELHKKHSCCQQDIIF